MMCMTGSLTSAAYWCRRRTGTGPYFLPFLTKCQIIGERPAAIGRLRLLARGKTIRPVSVRSRRCEWLWSAVMAPTPPPWPTTIFSTPNSTIIAAMAELPYSLMDSDTLPEYRYRSLQSHGFEADIRLLCLQPGSGIDPIVCTVFAVSFLENPEYECLSYTWGDKYLCSQVTIEDEADDGTL